MKNYKSKIPNFSKSCLDVLHDIDVGLWAGFVECQIGDMNYNAKTIGNKLLLKIGGQEFTIFIKKGNHTKEK